jgi:hypothetical protein
MEEVLAVFTSVLDPEIEPLLVAFSVRVNLHIHVVVGLVNPIRLQKIS